MVMQLINYDRYENQTDYFKRYWTLVAIRLFEVRSDAESRCCWKSFYSGCVHRQNKALELRGGDPKPAGGKGVLRKPWIL